MLQQQTDLRSWKQMSASQVPTDAELVVLATDPWTGNAWVGWHAEDETPCRAMVHESALEYAAPFKRKARVAEG